MSRLPSCRKGGCRHRSSALSLQTYPPVVNRWYGGQHKSKFGQERSSRLSVAKLRTLHVRRRARLVSQQRILIREKMFVLLLIQNRLGAKFVRRALVPGVVM